MPYPYRTSLARLNFTSSKVYEVSALLPAALWVSLRVLLGPTHTGAPSLTHHPLSRGPWVLWLVLCSALVFSSYTNELPCVNESRQPRGRVFPLCSLAGTCLRFLVGWALTTASTWASVGFARGQVMGTRAPTSAGHTGGSTQAKVQALTSPGVGGGGVCPCAAILRVA